MWGNHITTWTLVAWCNVPGSRSIFQMATLSQYSHYLNSAGRGCFSDLLVHMWLTGVCCCLWLLLSFFPVLPFRAFTSIFLFILTIASNKLDHPFMRLGNWKLRPCLNNSMGPMARNCPKWPSGNRICGRSCPPNLYFDNSGNKRFSASNSFSLAARPMRFDSERYSAKWPACWINFCSWAQWPHLDCIQYDQLGIGFWFELSMT